MSKRNKANMKHNQSAPQQTAQPAPASQSNPVDTNAAWQRWRISATLLEPAHPGSGAGSGLAVDALVARDRHGRPVIWAQHLEGLLRDVAARILNDAAALALFGKPGGTQQNFFLSSLYMDQDCETFIRSSSARAAFDNRAPKDDTLRAIELVPAGAVFTGHCEIPKHIHDLLKNLLDHIESIGHGRSTGSGRVQFKFEQVVPNPNNCAQPRPRLRLLLKNIDPLCITATATPENVIPTHPYIPGQTLLGALAAWLISEKQTDAAGLLVSGQISVSDALPLPATPSKLAEAEAEVAPAPLSLQRIEPDPTTCSVPWWAQATPPPLRSDKFDDTTPPPHGKPKRPEADLFVFRPAPNQPWLAYRPLQRIRLRNGRPDGHTQIEPALFAVEQIAEQTLFLADLAGGIEAMTTLRAALLPVLQGERWLGIGRGRAPVQVERANFTEPPTAPQPGNHHYLILTSDLLVRDQHLNWRSSLSTETVPSIPGWPAGALAEPLLHDRSPVRSFNGTARIWRQPAVAIRRGSIFKITSGSDLLTQAAHQGAWLGERTHEGFGRFRLDSQLPGVATAATPQPVKAAQDHPSEQIATTTLGWLANQPSLTSTDAADIRQRPTPHQWRELLADLESNAPNAFTSRLTPSAAGKRCWTFPAAKATLNSIEDIHGTAPRLAHARMFVRWLEARLQANRS